MGEAAEVTFGWSQGSALPVVGTVLDDRYRIEAPAWPGGRLPALPARDLRRGDPVTIHWVEGDVLAAAGPPDALLVALSRSLAEASTLDHPHITGIRGFGIHARSAFVVVDLGHGSGLETLSGADPRTVVRVAIDLLDALHHAHERGIVHGCLAADSISVTRAGQARIAHFGLLPLFSSPRGLRLLPPPPSGPLPPLEAVQRDIRALASLLLGASTGDSASAPPLARAFRAVCAAALDGPGFASANGMRRTLASTLAPGPLADGGLAPPAGDDAGDDAGAEHVATPRVPPSTWSAPPAPALVRIPGGLLRSAWLGDVLHTSVLIERHPVTNADFERFVADTGETPPRHWRTRTAPPGLRAHPVVNVSFAVAARYARWAGRRLPTAVEWEAAARPAGAAFPWGDAWDPRRINGPEAGIGGTTPVGCLDAGTSPSGVADLLGNVWEWVDTGDALPAPEEGCCWVYGGSFRHSARVAEGFARAVVRQGHCHDHVGFRCALDWDGVS